MDKEPCNTHYLDNKFKLSNIFNFANKNSKSDHLLDDYFFYTLQVSLYCFFISF